MWLHLIADGVCDMPTDPSSAALGSSTCWSSADTRMGSAFSSVQTR